MRRNLLENNFVRFRIVLDSIQILGCCIFLEIRTEAHFDDISVVAVQTARMLNLSITGFEADLDRVTDIIQITPTTVGRRAPPAGAAAANLQWLVVRCPQRVTKATTRNTLQHWSAFSLNYRAGKSCS